MKGILGSMLLNVNFYIEDRPFSHLKNFRQKLIYSKTQIFSEIDW